MMRHPRWTKLKTSVREKSWSQRLPQIKKRKGRKMLNFARNFDKGNVAKGINVLISTKRSLRNRSSQMRRIKSCFWKKMKSRKVCMLRYVYSIYVLIIAIAKSNGKGEYHFVAGIVAFSGARAVETRIEIPRLQEQHDIIHN
jgi:hypothetical protein